MCVCRLLALHLYFGALACAFVSQQLRKEKILESRARFLTRVGDRLKEVKDDLSNLDPWLGIVKHIGMMIIADVH